MVIRRSRPQANPHALFAAAFAVVLLLPATAEASCGDWLADHGSRHSVAEERESQANVEPRSSPSQPSIPSPCHGPTCGKQPNLPPVVPPPALVSAENERSAYFAASFQPRHEAPVLSVLADDPRPPSAVHSPLEHPPRAIR